MENKKSYCPKCYLSTFSPDWNKMNIEFDEMIKDLSLQKKKDIEINKINI